MTLLEEVDKVFESCFASKMLGEETTPTWSGTSRVPETTVDITVGMLSTKTWDLRLDIVDLAARCADTRSMLALDVFLSELFVAKFARRDEILSPASRTVLLREASMIVEFSDLAKPSGFSCGFAATNTASAWSLSIAFCDTSGLDLANEESVDSKLHGVSS